MLQKIRKIITLGRKGVSMASDIILEKNTNPMQPHLTPPQINFTSESKKIYSEIQDNNLSILVGKNNSGKSLLLKQLTTKFGETKKSHFVSVNRYQNFQTLSEYSPNNREVEDYRNSFLNNLQQPQNSENIFISLNQLISKLNDKKRDKLFDLMKEFFGMNNVSLKRTVIDNDASQKYVDCDGANLAYMSSGFRLCIYLLAVLLDDTFDTFLIDEPELGISPELQGRLADLLLNKENRERYFPHIKHLILATHSSIFLDAQDIGNNYKIEKIGNDLSIYKTKDRIQFYGIASFLGNRFETLGLPSAIICVEGETDEKYLAAVFRLRYPELRISILDAARYEKSKGGESKISGITFVLNKFVGKFQDSPYRNRIFIVADASFTKEHKDSNIRNGLLEENITIHSKNGIEYYYPQKILDTIFMTTNYQVNFNSKGEISFGDVAFSKLELNKKVIDLLSVDSQYPHELEEFLNKFEFLQLK